MHTCQSSDPSLDLSVSCMGCLEDHLKTVAAPAATSANPGYCCSMCGQGFDFGCRCPDY